MIQDIIIMCIFIMMYMQGKKISKSKDFFYIKVPKKLQKIYRAEYNDNKVPLMVIALETVCIITMILLFAILIYSIITGNDSHDLYITFAGIGILFLILEAIYAAMCDLFLRVFKKNVDGRKMGIKYLYDGGPFYVFIKKHYCPKCGAKLIIAYDSTIVDSRLPEAKKYDFSFGKTQLDGTVEFKKAFFECPSCKLHVSFKEMKEIEKRK